ncbi:hypothetical protein [Plasmodium yoelii yoelii]|uniref:Uncharacterized protein n=1 Tax=Plasmodium yoelii yoelii TaxID=73239 RepID=Q7REH2_PLAYO|nr:hypothetical protein [Plasmodium yoelii yoelii]
MNKFYIQIVFFLLTISLYVNNKALATELAPKTSTTSNSTHHYYTKYNNIYNVYCIFHYEHIKYTSV